MEFCGLCGISRAEHDSPDIHHVFTLEADGLELKVKGTNTPTPNKPVPSGVDRILLNLLGVLSAKGALTPEELSAIMGGAPVGIRRATPHPDQAS